MLSKITVVTVCFNAEKDIEATMKSVCEQDYGNIEYLIVDGQSKDSTMKIVEKIKEKYNQKSFLEIKSISEKDKGIYDAMNKGIDMASGDWILFLNAGDSLYSTTTITEVFSKKYDENISGIYGDTLRYYNEWEKRINGKPLEEIAMGIPLPFCHQSVFVKSIILKSTKFDLQYRLAGDYNFFVQCYLNKLSFYHVHIVVSKYAMGGVSEVDTVNHLKEKINIREKNGLEHYSAIKRIMMVLKLDIRQKIKKLLPRQMVKNIRGY